MSAKRCAGVSEGGLIIDPGMIVGSALSIERRLVTGGEVGTMF